jgi:hypothetical protein
LPLYTWPVGGRCLPCTFRLQLHGSEVSIQKALVPSSYAARRTLSWQMASSAEASVSS